jgi:hypothetical protein
MRRVRRLSTPGAVDATAAAVAEIAVEIVAATVVAAAAVVVAADAAVTKPKQQRFQRYSDE